MCLFIRELQEIREKVKYLNVTMKNYMKPCFIYNK